MYKQCDSNDAGSGKIIANAKSSWIGLYSLYFSMFFTCGGKTCITYTGQFPFLFFCIRRVLKNKKYLYY